MNSQTEKASATSIAVATLRASHLLLDSKPPVLDDTIILKLLEPQVIDYIKTHSDVFRKQGSMKLRAHVLLRSRYTEDCLQEAIENGIHQYLILGAGFDTFAYRQKPWSAGVKIFEVDHPVSQAQKIERLQQTGIEIPGNLTFVPVDFESSTLAEELSRSAFDFNQPVFISWLGVTMYLTMEAIDAVFAFVSSLPKMTEIVFTFAQPKIFDVPSSLAEKAAAMGEPWLSFFTVESLENKLKEHGFTDISFLSPDEATELYFKGRTDDLALAEKISIAWAVV